jgi:hypothetical protein
MLAAPGDPDFFYEESPGSPTLIDGLRDDGLTSSTPAIAPDAEGEVRAGVWARFFGGQTLASMRTHIQNLTVDLGLLLPVPFATSPTILMKGRRAWLRPRKRAQRRGRREHHGS